MGWSRRAFADAPLYAVFCAPNPPRVDRSGQSALAAVRPYRREVAPLPRYLYQSIHQTPGGSWLRLAPSVRRAEVVDSRRVELVGTAELDELGSGMKHWEWCDRHPERRVARR